MNNDELSEDISFFFHLLPLIGSALFSLVLWLPRGLSIVLPRDIFLAVTTNSPLFVFGLVTVGISLLVDIYWGSSQVRRRKIEQNIERMDKLAIFTLISSVGVCWSSTGYSLDFSKTAILLGTGTYALIFPAVILIMARVIPIAFKLDSNVGKLTKEFPIVLLIGSPMTLLLIIRFTEDLILAILSSTFVLAIGVFLMLYLSRSRN